MRKLLLFSSWLFLSNANQLNSSLMVCFQNPDISRWKVLTFYTAVLLKCLRELWHHFESMIVEHFPILTVRFPV